MTSDSPTPNVEHEWQRVLSNPDNIIMSDSLKEQLDPINLVSEIEAPKTLDIKCCIKFEELTIEGDLVEYTKKADSLVLTVTGSLEDCAPLIFEGDVKHVSIFNEIIGQQLNITVLAEDDPIEISFIREDELHASIILTIKT